MLGCFAGKVSGRLNPSSKPFTPLALSGASTPQTAADLGAHVQQSSAATITEAAKRLSPRPAANLPSEQLLKQAQSAVQRALSPRQPVQAPAGASSGTSAPVAASSSSTAKEAEPTESQVQRLLGVKVKANGLTASVEATPRVDRVQKPAAISPSGQAPQKPVQQAGTATPQTVQGPTGQPQAFALQSGTTAPPRSPFAPATPAAAPAVLPPKPLGRRSIAPPQPVSAATQCELLL